MFGLHNSFKPLGHGWKNAYSSIVFYNARRTPYGSSSLGIMHIRCVADLCSLAPCSLPIGHKKKKRKNRMDG